MVQGVAQSGCSRGGHEIGAGGDGGRPDGAAFAVLLTILGISQPAIMREALRQAEGPWGQPRPPEQEQSDGRGRQERKASVDAVNGDKGGSVVVWLMMGVLIAAELAGLCQCVSRWPGHAASPCGWWKGHSDLINPDVVLGGACAAIRTFRVAVNCGVALGLVSVEAM